MKLRSIAIRNFRRLEDVTIDLEDKETIFVGPNNSGKTSATAIFRCFLGGRIFKVHDFSVSRLADFEEFVTSKNAEKLPYISLDLWFDIDPKTIAFGRVFTLLPRLSDIESVGIRLSYGVKDAKKLLEQYDATFPANGKGTRPKRLFQYLAIDSNLSQHWGEQFASLEVVEKEDGTTEVVPTSLDPEEGKRLIRHLVRADFVDAQRNITDDDGSRSNRLSSAFAAYYNKNLNQPEHAADAHKVIDENNDKLTKHYGVQFAPLIELIKGLGVPSVNDRELQIISSLSPETALRGNTELLYVDSDCEHKLPELYNGLGFKNLIYMAIQAGHFHSQWLATQENRPLCQLIFIEEPEVHLHAQVQQTFIANIWNVIAQSIKAAGQPDSVPQLVITTHSSHILDAVDFKKVRYFQRCHAAGGITQNRIRNVSEVHSLRAFKPEAEIIKGKMVSSEDTLVFLKRYLRLTHCDLFFADAAILVEGAAEKLLLPSMIEESAQRLRSCYLTILEVGGAYAHRFESLLSFLHIPYLVITDLDSVDPADNLSACRADKEGARTSNASLKKLTDRDSIDDLVNMTQVDKFCQERDRFVAFQSGVAVIDADNQLVMLPRTLEEAISYENFTLLREEKLSIGKVIPDTLDQAYTTIYNRVRDNDFKKTDFAMDLLASPGWKVPAYIDEGLKWLEERLCKVASEAAAVPAGEGAA